MSLEFGDTGSFAAIKTGGGWKGRGTNCDSASFTGTYATEAQKICNSIMKHYPSNSSCTSNCLYFQSTSGGLVDDKFTIMAFLPYATLKAGGVAQYICFGSSGNTSIGPISVGGVSWAGAGCFANP